jgi:PAS domain S-box-containing protein
MNNKDLSKEELIKDLHDLHLEYERQKDSYERDIAKLKTREEELEKSEEKFRKAFTTSPDSININRLEDGMFISINKGFTKLTGYTEEDAIAKTSLELNIWKNPLERNKLVAGLESSGQVENMEAEFILKDGSLRFGLMSATIINLDGIPHILSITRDITDRKYAAVALQESETKYKELIELAVDGILIGSSDGTIIGANSFMLKLTGRPLNHLLGINIVELFIPDDLKNVPLRFDLLQRGETVINVRNLINPDGKTVPVEMHTKMMPDGTYQAIFHDITDRKESERALRESEEWFRNLFEQSSDGIFYLSENGKIETVNKAFAELHGYTIEEILEMNISDLDCPETKVLFPDRISRLMAGEDLKFEVAHFHKDGHRIPLEVTAGRVTVGSKKYIMASHRDITERLKAEEAMKIAMEKAEASDRLKTSFLNNISHEVRTPLNGILGFAEIISHSDLTVEERGEAFSMVHESSNRLLETITNYMDISLLVSGEMTVNKKEFPPARLLMEIYDKYNSACNPREIELLLKIPENSGNHYIYSDPELLNKILNQLLGNAVKFTEKGQIQYGYKIINDEAEFFIIDTGIGIGIDSVNTIFDHFVKEDQIKTRPTEGSGLGLSISRGLVGLLGGKIWVEATKGSGSSFFFTIQGLINPDRNIHEAEGRSDNKTEKLSSILVAEDDEANFLYLRTLLLQNTNAEVIHAANGREAIEKFSSIPGIELVLMDIKMPDINGFEATQKIKAMNPGVPVIAITAYAMLGDERRILEAGCDGYLSKPISKKSLLDKMSEYIKI